MTEDRLVGGWTLLTVIEDLVGAGAARLRQRLLVNSRLGTATWCWT